MKLVKIQHYRCDEPRYITLAWAPDEMTEDQVQERVHNAQNAYLAQLKAWKQHKEQEAPAVPWTLDYDQHLDKTVREVKEIHAQKKAAYNEWEKVQTGFKRSFGQYLDDEGLTEFWAEDPELSLTVDWGHRHGESLDLSPTEWEDMPGMIRYKDF